MVHSVYRACIKIHCHGPLVRNPSCKVHHLTSQPPLSYTATGTDGNMAEKGSML